MHHLECDVCIVGGGTGGTAAALALADYNLKVVMTEETDWVGGQLTSQAVPPDENPWIESTGCTSSYRSFRNLVREHYRIHESLTPSAHAQARINPGGGWVSHLCFSPAIGQKVLTKMLSKNSNLNILLETVLVNAEVSGDFVKSVVVQNLKSGIETQIVARYFLDATELGDLLPHSGTEYKVGSESKSETQEPNATDFPAEPENVQSFTWCAVVGWDENDKHIIEKPNNYEHWLNYQPPNWPDKLLSFWMLNVRTGQKQHFPLFGNNGFNLFTYRQIIDKKIHTDSRLDATVVNWPMNDYDGGTVIDVDTQTAQHHYQNSRDLTLSLIYWLQTEQGFGGLFLCPELTGTPDGLAKSAYIRESRRIRAMHTVREQDVAAYVNPDCLVAPVMPKSVGIGAYRIDLHPSANGRPTIDTSTLPFQIPLGSLVPIRMRNILPACKNLGVTHITNGCYRLHPIEWNIGESAAILTAFCLQQNVEPHQVLESDSIFADYENWLWKRGVLTDWPRLRAL